MAKLFAGTAHPELAQEVSRLMGNPLSRVAVTRFGNSEVKVRIEEDVRNETCFVIQPTSNPTDTHLVELLFFCDALKRQEAAKVIGIIPYFGYAKQNIEHTKGESVSVNVVIRTLESIGFNKIYAFDLHDEATGGVFSIPFKNMSAFPLLAEQIASDLQKEKISLKDVVLVSPDQGAVEKVRNFGETFYGTRSFSEAVIEKQRDQLVAHKAKPLGLYGDVKNKVALIVDDMVVSGSTLLPAVDLCLERGAKEVYACAIHHDFTENASTLLENSELKRFYTTNTIHLEKKYHFSKLREFSIAPLLAKELKS